MLRPVVVGIDGSPESLAAAHWAAREALLRGRSLRLVHAWEGMAGDDATLPELQVPRDRASHTLRRAVDRLIECHPHLRISADVIARPARAGLLAEAKAAEMLVLGSRGLGGVGGFLVGSVAQAVVAHAWRPVVLVRAGTVVEDDRVPSPADGASTLTPHGPVVLGIDPSHPCGELVGFVFDEAARRHAPLQAVHAIHRRRRGGALHQCGHGRGVESGHGHDGLPSCGLPPASGLVHGRRWGAECPQRRPCGPAAQPGAPTLLSRARPATGRRRRRGPPRPAAHPPGARG
ncbi:universal stress protein [Streptomyces sp. NBC_01210]|uniref:universal stress protein n=1 Tax=Streptomyces sp. NBC_01210 TaxID=2903774 RepID=UPI003FA370F5